MSNKNPRDIIIRPVVSEKSYAAFDANVYTFVVADDANKIEIRKAIESIFDVTVTDVNVSKVPAKPKRRGMTSGSRAGWKKAVVTVAEGQTIEAFGPGV